MEEGPDQTVVKALFRSPIQNIRHAIESDVTEHILLKVTLDQRTQAALNSIQQDLHTQRLKNLREKLASVENESWLHQPIEKLIGLQ